MLIWYVFIQRFAVMYLNHFRQLSEIGQKYSSFFLGMIFLKSRPDHWKLRLISSNKMFESIEM